MSDSSTDAQAIDLTSLDEALGGGGDSSVAAANKSANEGSNAPSTSASLPASDEAHNTTAPLASGPDEKATRTEEAVPQSPATLSPASLSPQSLSPNPVAPAPLPDVQADAAPQGETAEEAGARHAAAGAGLAAQDTAPATNPDVEAFRGMFPDLAPDVIAAVLHAHNGNSESAINALLAMADPSYQAPAVDAQHEADAALARSLAAEQERGFRSSQAARDYSQPARTLAGSQAGGTGATYTNLTYQPRVRRAPVIPGARAAYSAPSPPGQDPDRSMVPGMPGPVEAKQWQGEINKFAENGIARAASTFSMLKARASALAQGQGASPQSDARAQGSGGYSGNSSSYFPSFSSGAERPSPHSPHMDYDRDPAPVGETDLSRLARGSAPSPKPDRNSAAAFASGRNKAFADRYGRASGSTASGRGQGPAQSNTQGAESEEFLGWDAAGRTSDAQMHAPITLTDNTANSNDPKANTGLSVGTAAGTGAAIGAGAGLAAGAATSPIHLMDQASGQGLTPRGEGDDDSDDLEYVSNPFEDED